jgi:hypothetical protein
MFNGKFTTRKLHTSLNNNNKKKVIVIYIESQSISRALHLFGGEEIGRWGSDTIKKFKNLIFGTHFILEQLLRKILTS